MCMFMTMQEEVYTSIQLHNEPAGRSAKPNSSFCHPTIWYYFPLMWNNATWCTFTWPPKTCWRIATRFEKRFSSSSESYQGTLLVVWHMEACKMFCISLYIFISMMDQWPTFLHILLHTQNGIIVLPAINHVFSPRN